MTTLENYRNEDFVAFCNKALSDYTQSTQGVSTALLATLDGFEITSYSPFGNNEYSDNKLAAVGSSLFALSLSLVNEFNLKDCKSITLDSEKGKIFISSIKHNSSSIILMVQTNENATLGTVMHGAKKLNENIAKQMSTIVN